jgi:hypothetical protein
MALCKIETLRKLGDFESLVSSLDISAEHFKTNENFFSCCGGAGHYLCTDKNVMLRCSLVKRFRHLKEFMLRVAEYHKDRDPVAVLRESEDLWSKRRHDLKKFSGKTKAFVDKVAYGDTSASWAAVFRWIWQYGREAEIIHFTSAARRSLDLTNAMMEMHGERLLFIYGIDHLWDQPYVDALEYLINFCEQGQFQICLMFQPQAPRRMDPVGRRSKIFRHVAQLKAGDPLQFLTEHMRSRLQTMSLDKRVTTGPKKAKAKTELDIGF